MNIRNANDMDIPAIVNLLKASLGESVIKKTVPVWHFKHIDNPFGKSCVLIAEEDNEFIGLRAFMQWRWQFSDKTWVAYRAVDTATHPNHQGKGIFKNLTLQALKEVGEKKDTFIFNTPNNKSKPGYLKMGWRVIDRIKLSLVPAVLYWPFYAFSNKQYSNLASNKVLDELCKLQNQLFAQQSMLFTPKSAKYLRWRYEDNPIQQYMVFSNSNWYLAMYVKKHRYFRELRVAEVIIPDKNRDYKTIRRVIIQMSKKKKCLFITIATDDLFGMQFSGKFGPQLTFRDLTEDPYFLTHISDIDNWNYHLGDLELF